MNSTSAGERGGRLARVDDGSLFVGAPRAPGAPGCTTTGFAGSDCCPSAAGEQITVATLAARNARIMTPRSEPARRGRACLQWSMRRNIFIWTNGNLVTKQGIFKGKKERSHA